MNKALSVLAVVAILGASFFAGQKSFGVTVEYDHADVIDAVNGCSEGQFIGECKRCSECSTDSYAAGGCSYFKDTFCTLCTSIKNCEARYISCTNQYDQVCTQCNPEFYIEGNRCLSCTICGANERVVAACTRDTDTECAACSECGENEWTSKVCKYDEASDELLSSELQGRMPETDTECTQCLECQVGDFKDVKCQGGDIHNLGAPTVCEPCEGCGVGEYATASCNIFYKGQTECQTCDSCAEGQYISQQCDQGHPFDLLGAFMPDTLGSTTVCADCTEPDEGEWTVFPCNPLHTSDAIHQECSRCQAGEYQYAPCTASSDTICPACPNSFDTLMLGDPDFPSGLQYCMKDPETGVSEMRCSAIEDDDGGIVAGPSTCGEWTDPIANQARCTHAHSGRPNCGEWISYCMDGFTGDSCCYHESDFNCGTITSRERNGKRAGFIQGEDFVDFCRVLCDEFPDCMAFEVMKDGTDETCYFKASYTQNQKNQWIGSDDRFSCYSNTCRQNTYSPVGATINYKPESTKRARLLEPNFGGRRR